MWRSIQSECAGKIDSLIELLQGRLSSAVMQVVTRQSGGLFPAPRDIELDCSCPDWADLCKHVAASLYGVGARLDSNPELLFVLRDVDPSDLINKASAAEAVRQTVADTNGAPSMSDAEVADVFGIELESGHNDTPAPPAEKASPPSSPLATIAAPAIRVAGSVRANPRRPRALQKLNAKARARIAAAMRARWQRAKKQGLLERTPLRTKPSVPSNKRRTTSETRASAYRVL
jgi:uncharacterized Zn finger protein